MHYMTSIMTRLNWPIRLLIMRFVNVLSNLLVFTGRVDNMLVNLPVKCSHHCLKWNSSYRVINFFIIICNYDIKQQSWWLYTTVAILAVINSDACSFWKSDTICMLVIEALHVHICMSFWIMWRRIEFLVITSLQLRYFYQVLLTILWYLVYIHVKLYYSPERHCLHPSVCSLLITEILVQKSKGIFS